MWGWRISIFSNSGCWWEKNIPQMFQFQSVVFCCLFHLGTPAIAFPVLHWFALFLAEPCGA